MPKLFWNLFFTHPLCRLFYLLRSPRDIRCILGDAVSPGRDHTPDNPAKTNRKPWERSRSVSWFLKLIEKKFVFSSVSKLEYQVVIRVVMFSKFQEIWRFNGYKDFTIHLRYRAARTNFIKFTLHILHIYRLSDNTNLILIFINQNKCSLSITKIQKFC